MGSSTYHDVSRGLTTNVIAHVLKDKVPRPAFIQHFDPIHHTPRDIHQRRISSARKQSIQPYVIRPNLQRVYRLLRDKIQRSFLLKVRRKLALEQ
jgi:hypothetical protein